jgi:hypothetical protein
MGRPTSTGSTSIASAGAWRALSVAVALSLFVSGSVACRRNACELPDEPDRALDLRLSADREHIVQDLATVRTVADAYGDEAARAPIESNGPAAQRAAPGRGPRAVQYCESLLLDRISAIHHVTTAELRTLVPMTSER